MSLEFQKLQDIYFVNQNMINEYPIINKQFLFWLDPNQFKINNVENFISTIEKNLKLLEQINFKIRMNEVKDQQLLSFVKSQMQFNELPLVFDKLKFNNEADKSKDSKINEIKSRLVSIYENQNFEPRKNKNGYIKNDIEKYLNIEKSYTSLSGEYGVEYFGLLKGVFDSQSKAGQFKDLTLQLKQLIS